jgi:hypothetical protein
VPDFTCSFSQPPAAFIHFWKHTVGSGHAPLALRADWQAQMLRCHNELGFEHVRFHGLLSDEMGTLVCEEKHSKNGDVEMSVGVSRITAGFRIRIDNARTTNTYGRRRSSSTIRTSDRMRVGRGRIPEIKNLLGNDRPDQTETWQLDTRNAEKDHKRAVAEERIAAGLPTLTRPGAGRANGCAPGLASQLDIEARSLSVMHAVSLTKVRTGYSRRPRAPVGSGSCF